MSYTSRRKRPTIGVLAGWQFYWTPTQLSYLAPVFRGISQAAKDLDCNVLLGCGMGPSAVLADQMRPAWPLLLPDADFIPIGPWNTDGIIVANPLQSPVRSHYLQDLMDAGHPILFIGSGEHGPTIAADNVGGIREAVEHLIKHGHQRIAFIAGSREDKDGDSGERLKAYQVALEACNLEIDSRLIAYGRHVYGGGASAMRQIMDSGAEFTAVLASNDESALGAIQVLKEAGRRIPQDIAIIGFDDRTESAAAEPALSSVRIPLYSVGYRALELIRQHINGQTDFAELVTIPTRLVVRESCGCIRRKRAVLSTATPSANLETRRLQLAQIMASTVLQTQGLTDDECQDLCQHFVDAFIASLERNDPLEFQTTLDAALMQTAADGDDAHIWQEALSILARELKTLPIGRSSALNLADEMLDQARLTISLQMQKQHQRRIVDQRWAINRLSVLTADLLNALDETQVFESLAKHLPNMGIHRGLIVLFQAESNDPVGWSTLRSMLAPSQPPVRFRTTEFPPGGLFPPDQPFNLALLPLANQRGQLGYAVFDTDHVDLYGAIVQQLAGALNTAQLYREATEGRRLAEEANQIKSRFLSTVSHELRTPLNLIVGLSKILLQESDDSGLSGLTSARKDIERIHAQAQHLGGLIGDVLDLASSDAGQLRLTNEYIDLGQTLHIVGEIGRQLAADKGLVFDDSLPRSGPWVWGDRTRLRQVVLNLINNAIKFTAQGSIRLQLDTGDDSVTVSVIDTGLGIPVDEQQAIFDEFHQSERSISRGYGGLGLGLAICKRLVEMHSGKIGVRSTGGEGEGSTFYFTLPTVATPDSRDQPLAAALAEQRVLLLTTPTGTSGRLQDHLRQRGFEVHMALLDEPATWQSFLAVTPPDAVVLDASLTSDHAWNVLRTTMGNPALLGVPVLIYASSQQNGSVLELDLLTKPIRFGELKRLIDQQWATTEGPAPARTILVVDDDTNTLEVHSRIVQSQVPSSRVLQARNGLEALDILHQTRVDLVLLDLIMPEMDGFGVLEAMREQESTHDIPVIVLTGRVLTEADMQRLNRGVATVLSKGLFSVDETLAHITTALERTRKLSSKTQRLVRQAMAYLHEHFAEPISRQDVARHVGMAEDHLTHCFRQELGMTPITYLNRYRINQAKQLLKDSDHSITEIALEVGFSDSGYFSRVFRREVGMSPEVYRRT